MIKQLLNSLGITNESLSSSLVSDVVFTEKVNGLIVTVERNENDLFFITGLNAEGSSEPSFYFKNETVFKLPVMKYEVELVVSLRELMNAKQFH